MPRQPKSKIETTVPSVEDLMKTIQLQKEQMDLMMKQLESLQQSKEEKIEYQKENPEDFDINGREYINVMSLNPYGMVLTTEPKGAGRQFIFNKFGEIQRIMYDELRDILRTYRHFAEQGRFYILDRRVIRQHGLDDVYSRILNKEQIEKILSNQGDALTLYDSANDVQKTIIVNFLVKALRDNPDSVDMNLVDKISRKYGIKIYDIAEDARMIKGQISV